MERICKKQHRISEPSCGNCAISLHRSAGDEEPLVVDPINWGGFEFLVPFDLAGAGFFAVLGVGNADVGAGRRLARDLLKTFERKTHREIPPRPDLPVMSLSQASAHSRTTSVAYLENHFQLL